MGLKARKQTTKATNWDPNEIRKRLGAPVEETNTKAQIEVVRHGSGMTVYINGARVAGPSITGPTISRTFEVRLQSIVRALNKNNPHVLVVKNVVKTSP